jgi:hypothetical protein
VSGREWGKGYASFSGPGQLGVLDLPSDPRPPVRVNGQDNRRVI